MRKTDEMDNDPEMQAMEHDGTKPAPAGQIYVCGACGKTSPTRYGFDAQEKSVSSDGWDESCMLNAVLCSATKVDGMWVQAGHVGQIDVRVRIDSGASRVQAEDENPESAGE